MPSSSLSSRMSAASGASPGWTLPPGNSHNPAIILPAGRCASSTRPSPSTSATATTRTMGSGSAAVAAIDVDVAVRQVAGPDRRAALADAEIERDVDFAPGHVLRHRRLVIAGHRPALLGDPHAADGDGELVALGFLARLAHGHDDAAPIGVAGGERGLDQRRIPDREADAPRRAVAFGAGHLDRDEFFGTLAVARQLLREIGRHRREGPAEIAEKRVVGAGDRRVPRLLRRA